MGAAFIPFEGWDYIDTLHAVKKVIFADWGRQLSMRQQRKSSGIWMRFMSKSSQRLE
jgi:hypothetical protein